MRKAFFFNRLIGFIFSGSIIGMLCSGCSQKVVYNWQGKNYETAEEAHAAFRADLEKIMNEITETKTPVGGTAAVILPAFEYIKNNFVTIRGNPRKETKEKLTSYSANGYMIALLSRAENIAKRKVFDKIDIRESGDPENSEFLETFAILVLKKEGKPNWFLKKKEAPNTLILIESPPTGLPPLQREIMWLNALEKEAK
jgi:hypothetical protein